VTATMSNLTISCELLETRIIFEECL
jgi:hypothetical protein